MSMNTRSRNNKKGYYTLEAAIFLPVFIIAILTMGYVIKVIGAGENVMHAATDESRLLVARAYNVKLAPFFSAGLEKRILDEERDVTDIDVKRFRYLYGKDGDHGLISFDLDYRIDIKLPLPLYDGFDRKDKVLCRGFIGYSGDWDPMSFSDMEKNGDSSIVWIFPLAGQRYHSENCRYVKPYPRRALLCREMRARYGPCELCHPEGISDGNLVYCFTASGEAYHRGSCKTVDKYVISIEKSEAESRGYTCCSVCGGGG